MNLIKKWLGLSEPEPTVPNRTFEEVMAGYQVIDVVTRGEDYPPFVIVSPVTQDSYIDHNSGLAFSNPSGNLDEEYRASVLPVVHPSGGHRRSDELIQLKEQPKLGEVASASPSPFIGDMRREYNRKLVGLQGIQEYDRMRKSNGIVAGTLLAIKTPVYAGNWRVDPASDSKRDKNAAEFVQKVLFEYQSITWTQILIDAMLSADFGMSVFEKVWDIRVVDGKERAVLQKLAPRHPMDVKEINYDRNGGPKSIVFYVKDGEYGYVEREIPISKLLVVTHQREVGDIQGRSALRPAYQHYYYTTQLYKIDAIQKERHGIGIPVIKLPVGFSANDVAEANVLGRNLRTNERAHIVLPPMWEIEFAKLEGQPVDAMRSIEYHDKAIRESVLAGFIGSDRVTKDEDLGLFLKSTRFIANSICDAFNTYLIPDIMKYNFDKVGTPKLVVRQIGEQADNRTMSFTIRNMVGAGIIRPDDKLENYLRELLDLPPVDLATVRVVKAPQAGQVPGSMPNATPGTNTKLPNNSPTKPDGKDGANGTPENPGLPRQTPTPAIGVGGAKVGDNNGQ